MITYKELLNRYKKRYVDENNVILAIGPEFFKESYAYLKTLPEDEEVDIYNLEEKYKDDIELPYLTRVYDDMREEEMVQDNLNKAEKLLIKLIDCKNHVNMQISNEDNLLITEFKVYKHNCAPLAPATTPENWFVEAEMMFEQLVSGNINKIQDYDSVLMNYKSMLLDVKPSLQKSYKMR